MFFRADNRAAVFIDYEYWYVSMKDRYRVRPDLDSWCRQIREKYQVERLSFFGDFQHPSFSGEVSRIRAVSNDIIETKWESHGQAVKDMSDVIMLDAIYRLAAKKKSQGTGISSLLCAIWCRTCGRMWRSMVCAPP